MNIKELKRIYFIGIGGIGMSALARFFAGRGVVVSGYDRTETELTQKLKTEGISIHFADDTDLLDKEAELVVYTPAMPKDHKELNWYRDNNFPIYKRSDVLQWITESMFSITVAGTHGKTTTSTMIAFMLRETGVGCNAFLGGISSNYESNYWSSDNNVAVVEADEYDRSFLKLSPDIAILTAMDADHLDIYGTVEAMEDAFIEYTGKIKPAGTLIVHHGLHRAADLKGDNKLSYSLQNNSADAYAGNIVQHKGGYTFNYYGPKGSITDLYLPIGGMHNIENAVAAISAVLMLGVTGEKIKEALAEFKGVKRRFEYVIKDDTHVFIDDYAHHPEELAALIKSAKHLFADRKCTVIFQPHLYSRTRDLADGFAESLNLADEVLLMDIYPARELPMEGVSSKMIADKMTQNVHILNKVDLLEFVAIANPELLITAGAGDIDKMVNPIKQILDRL